jgi:anti-anti-sigma factor
VAGLQSELLIDVHRTDGTTHVRLSGEVALEHHHELEDSFRQVLRSAPPEIVVDLAAVTFIDSSGLRCLVRTRDEANRTGIGFRLGEMSDSVERLFEVLGLLDVFEVQRH